MSPHISPHLPISPCVSPHIAGEELPDTHLVPNLIARAVVREYAEEHAGAIQECDEYLERLRVAQASQAGQTAPLSRLAPSRPFSR